MQTDIRVAVVTGAAQGIGRKTAEVLAKQGFALALTDLNSTQATQAAIKKLDGASIEVLGDVSREEDVLRIAETVQSYFGRVDVLVNNAGISFICPAEEIEAEAWRRVLEVNLTG